MGMRTWLTNLSENAQIRLLNVQLDRLYKALGLTGDSGPKDGSGGSIISYPIAVDKGGTGASDAEGAREALEVSHKDHTHHEINNSLSIGGESTGTEETPKLESYYPAYLYGGLAGVKLGNGITFEKYTQSVSAATTAGVKVCKLTADGPGLYIAFGEAVFSQNGSHIRIINVNVGSETITQDTYAPQSYQQCRLAATAINRLSEGEEISVSVQQNSGATLSVACSLYVLKIPLID